MLTLLLTPSGATFSMLLRFRLLGASAIGEDFWRWRPLLKGSLSRCGDSVSLPMDRDRPMPPFIFPQNQTPLPYSLSQLHCHLTQTPRDTRSTTTFPPRSTQACNNPTKRSTNVSSSLPYQQPGNSKQRNFKLSKQGQIVATDTVFKPPQPKPLVIRNS